MITQHKVCILIPTFNPDEKLPRYIESLINSGFKQIIIVNDGSDSRSLHIFNKIKLIEENNAADTDIFIYEHAVNLGKGRALKNGINYYLIHLRDRYSGCMGIITVDSDGQHLVEDVNKLSTIIENEDSGLILGCRDFTLNSVPPKSRFGNQMTKVVMKLLFGRKISDTQTGLRGFSNKVLGGGMIELYGERFEYETNVLIDCIKKNIPIKEITINTVYENNNSGTHFRPIVDSLKIYRLIFRQFFNYMAVSLSSFLVDCTLFWILCRLLPQPDGNISSSGIWIATAGARCVSSIYNYFMNKFVVFGHREKEIRTLIQYFILCITIMLASAFSVSMLYSLLKINEVLIKCAADTVLFCISYFVQDRIIFASQKGDN